MSAQVEEASSAPVLIELYQHGDLTLNVGEDLNGEPTHRFRVSRHTMCMASPVWRAMLTGQFIEATKNEIPFVDDDPEALLLVLRVAHLKVHEVSRSLTLPQLINVATICDKYDTVSICQPFVGEWVQSWLLDSLTQIGQTINRHLSAGCEGWLWVAWVFGYQKQFTELANLLRISIETDATGTCFTKRGLFQTKVLIANMPPDIVESLLQVRQNAIATMLDIFYTYFDQVVQGNACEARPPRPQPGLFGNSLKSDQNADCCHALTLGLLINGFAPLGNCYLRVRATEVHTSPMGVYLTLSKIKFHSWREPVSDDEKNHTICNFMTEMRAKLDEAYQAMASPVLESHILHMKKQWAKGRTAP